MEAQKSIDRRNKEVPVSTAERRFIFARIFEVIHKDDVAEGGYGAISKVAEMIGIPPNVRRGTKDVDPYILGRIRTEALEGQGFKPCPYAAKEIPERFEDKILFRRIKVNGRYIPVDFLNNDVFDHTVTVPGYNMKITNTQNVIMKDALKIDGIKTISMPFIVINKAQAHIECGIRHRNEGDPLKTDKHGKDAAFILRYILKQTPEQFMEANKELIRYVLKDEESKRTLLKVLKEVYYGNSRERLLRR